jgi:hypothetical protein
LLCSNNKYNKCNFNWWKRIFLKLSLFSWVSSVYSSFLAQEVLLSFWSELSLYVWE